MLNTVLNVYRNLALDENGVSVTPRPAILEEIICQNAGEAFAYLKVYDLNHDPDVGSDTPLLTIPVQNGNTVQIPFSTPVTFANGIGVGCTANAADDDTDTATLLINILWSANS